jgi:aspartyl protease family protein
LYFVFSKPTNHQKDLMNMGLQDRDYMHNRSRSSVSRSTLGSRFERFAQTTNLAWIAVFWLGIMGLLFVVMTHYTNQRKTVIEANGVMTIKKDRDGHFYAPGAINGQQVMFLVDTGATLISISDDLARLARLPAGEPTQFSTAGGMRTGTIVSGITVQVGSFQANNMRVSTGLDLNDKKQALLGQNFLSKFTTQTQGDTLTLTPLTR